MSINAILTPSDIFDKVQRKGMKRPIAGLREQHKAATRKELSRFGLQLFLKQGFANTTIDEIVAPLGIAKRTFFRYFDTKEDLVFAWQEDKTSGLVEALAARPERETPFKAVCEALSSLLDRYDAYPDRAFALMRLIKETPSLVGKDLEKQALWERALADGLIDREGKRAMSRIKAQIIVGVVMSAFSAALDEWYAGGGKGDLRRIVKKAFSIAERL